MKTKKTAIRAAFLPCLLIVYFLLSPGFVYARGRIEVEAIAGRPFGVARVSFTPDEVAGLVDIERLRVEDAAGRCHYPAVQPGLLGKLLGAVLNEGRNMPAGRLNVSFLFRGDEPFVASIFLPGRLDVEIVPVAAPERQQQRLVADWWRDYQKSLGNLTADGDFPPLVQTYLLSMLANRLALERPALPGGERTAPITETQRSLEMLLGLEKLHDEMLRDVVLGRFDDRAPANQALPGEWQWPKHELAPAAEVVIEPIAKHVPAECFYIRMGKFSNYLWFDQLQEDYGGDLSTMISLRAYESPMTDRGEKQLGLEKSAVGDLFGDAVIADVALIGRDTFLEEGGAFGILFQAKNGLLANDMKQQHKRSYEKFKDRGAKLETLKIAGKDVSFLSTPDNRLRSFYAADGAFHLVTTSRAIVERFFEAGEGKEALADTPEFRYTRQQMPLTREDTIFAYFSPQFFQGLLSPHYQVELHRRMRAVIDIELVQLAYAAAKSERLAAAEIPELSAVGLLPPQFGKRSDGSGPIITENRVVDSLRGPRGYFLPIPDVAIAGITADEAQHCQAQLESLRQSWGRMDPLVVGVRRYALNDKGRERLIVDANIMPLDETKFGQFASVIGPPTQLMVMPLADDVVTVQAAIKGGLIFPSVPPHQLFVGVKDLPPLGTLNPKGLLGWLQLIRSTPGYLGGWPKPGFMDMLPFGLGGRPDPWGFSQLPFGLWRWQGAGFSVLSFDQPILGNAAAELRVVDGEVPAQLRIHAKDFSSSRFAEYVTQLSYQRSLEASRGNTRLLHLMTQQFHLPVEEAKSAAEKLLEGKLVCPLGGEYQLVERGGVREWTSTAWLGEREGRPPEYRSPLLAWFRGLDLYLIKQEGGAYVHAELDMQRKPSDKPKLELPQLFNLFGNGQKAVKPAEPIEKPQPDPKPAAAEPNGNEPVPPPLAPPRKEGELRSILKQKAAEPSPVDELPVPSLRSKMSEKTTDKPPQAPRVGREF